MQYVRSRKAGLARLTIGAASVAGLLLACGSFVAEGPLDAGSAVPDAASDAVEDASDRDDSDGDASDAGLDDGVLATDDFETADGHACSDWSPTEAIATVTTAVAYMGKSACRLCANPGASTPFARKRVPYRGPGLYSLSFYVRGTPGKGAWTGIIQASVGEPPADTSVGSGGTILTDTWAFARVTGRRDDPAISMSAILMPPPDSCIDFDDVVFSYAP